MLMVTAVSAVRCRNYSESLVRQAEARVFLFFLFFLFFSLTSVLTPYIASMHVVGAIQVTVLYFSGLV